jgi:hypothetical protein
MEHATIKKVATQLLLIISYHITYHIISYIISYHIISYHIISYRIISYYVISYYIISYIILYIISYHIYHIISYQESVKILVRKTLGKLLIGRPNSRCDTNKVSNIINPFTHFRLLINIKQITLFNHSFLVSTLIYANGYIHSNTHAVTRIVIHSTQFVSKSSYPSIVIQSGEQSIIAPTQPHSTVQ